MGQPSVKCQYAEPDSLIRATRQRITYKSKVKGVKLLSHEQALVEAGQLIDVTHDGASAIWLRGDSLSVCDDAYTLVYRPMGDDEYTHLSTTGTLPDTQPY